MTVEEAMREAIKVAGSQAALARQLKVKPPTVNQWAKGLRPVPPLRAVEIETLTGVSKAHLCPSFPWATVAA